MSLLKHIQTAQTPRTPKCKTCSLLNDMTVEDRTDFKDAVDESVPASVLSRAINGRLAEMNIDTTVSESSVKAHIRNGHTL